MSWLRKLFKGNHVESNISNEWDFEATYVMRNGESTEADAVYFAWTSGDLDAMYRVIDTETNPTDRHFLLMGIVQETYKRRYDNPKFSVQCEEIAWQHIHELPAMENHLIEIGGGKLPQIPTFKILATLLTERGEFTKAIEVCQKALDLGLTDGTKGGFEGRIKSIQRLHDKE